MTRIAKAAKSALECEVTPAMRAAGVEIIFSTPGVADLGIFFDAGELVERVYLAMAALDRSTLPRPAS